MIAPITGNIVQDFIILGFVLSVLWGTIGTTQRRRNLKSFIFGTKSPAEIVSQARLDAIADKIQPHILRAYSMRRWAIGFTVFVLCLNSFLVYGVFSAQPEVMVLMQKIPEATPFIAFFMLGMIFFPAAAYKTFLKRTVVPDTAAALGFAYGYRGVGVFNRLLAAEDTVVRAPLRQNLFGKSGSLLVGSFDRWAAEDGFENPNLRFEELQTINVSESRGKREESEAFHGMIVEITVNRYFPCSVLLLEDLGRIGNAITSMPGGLERVGLEDPEFESLFEVYSADQIGARKILTPRFMEKVKQLADYFPSAVLSGLFVGNRFYLVVRTHKNLFELGSVLTPPDSYKSLGSLAAQIELQKQLVESLED